MAKRIKHAVQLVNQSLTVFYNNKKLMFLPLISNIIIITLMIVVLHPLSRFEQAQIVALHHNTKTIITAYAIVLSFLFIVHQIVFYFNAAIAHCTLAHFNGKPVSIKSGIKAANASFWKFYLWNLFAGTLGILINLFQSKLHQTKFHQKIFLGLRWLIASNLIIPIIVTERIGPVKALKKSAMLIWKAWANETAINWQDNLKPNFGFISLLLIGRVVFLIPTIIGAIAGGHRNIMIGLFFSIALLTLISTVSTITRVVLSCALYLFAKDGFVPEEFSEQLLKNAFITKSQLH
jgi:hypothetical protein